MMGFRDNMQKCQDYIHGLEDERKKIQVFQRELPLCFQLVTQAIEACRRQLSGTSTTTECSEQTTSNNGPILEEFIPIITTTHSDDIIVDDEHECDKPQFDSINLNNLSTNNDNSGKKSDWLKSVQLWNQTLDPPTNQQDDDEPKKVGVVEVKNNNGGGAFHSFIMKEKNSSRIISNNENSNTRPTTTASLPAASACSSAEAAEDVDGSGSGLGNGHKEEEKNGKSDRKARRCWSPELHRRFLHALEQLGGAHVATPKQIRELMRVDGLTNDEVKSHLQKYRLHTRRPTSSNNANTCTVTPTTAPQPHQFVVVGGIWVPPPHQEFPVYTPVSTVAAAPQPRPQLKMMLSTSHLRCSERRSPRDGSSSSHAATTTTTAVASHGHAF